MLQEPSLTSTRNNTVNIADTVAKGHVYEFSFIH